ncbi:aromatic motif membrane protein [[Mycoplasma] gypis]|uniref:Aromatic motif membrane protein n=1 Tax=[Mycoplasma] gypis TaxID=92404 RepID=A0ABZ2RUI6_9BACT|nr:aromatic motif membrane protein [[Mycoplasma] gypis]MBN0919490.1 hypothetical protein [[Mycoplasma] gypis]
MKLNKLLTKSLILGLVVLSPLAAVSCITKEQSNEQLPQVNQILSPEAFLKQSAIQTILNEYYKKDSYETKTIEQLNQEKEEYIKAQLSEEAIKKHTQNLAKIFQYYSVAKLQTKSVWGAKNKINYFNEFEKMWNEYLTKNWLFFLYSINNLISVGSSEVITQEGGEFNRRYASFLPWQIQNTTNKIDDFAAFIVGGSILDPEWLDFESVSPKKGNDWKVYFETFYLKMSDKSIVSLQISREEDPDSKQLIKSINLLINGRIYILKKIITKEISDFNIADIARYLLRYTNDIKSKVLSYSYPLYIPKKDDIRWTIIEEEYGDLVPYLPAKYIGEKHE